jgi:hypothetical protein
MSTAPSPVSELQQDLQAVEQIGVDASSPFVKSAAGQAKVGTAVNEINLGIAALPVLIDLFKSFAGLLSHVHTAATAASATAPAIPAAAQGTTAVKQ